MQRQGHHHMQLRGQIWIQDPQHTQRHTTRQSQGRTHWWKTSEHACRHLCMNAGRPNCITAATQTYVHTIIHPAIHSYIQTDRPPCIHACMRAAHMYACYQACIHICKPAVHHTCKHTVIHAYTQRDRQSYADTTNAHGTQTVINTHIHTDR